MGFFSWDCQKCGVSIKAPYNIPKALIWQNRCVAVLPNGNTVHGKYDGYGRISGVDVSQEKPTMYHEKCWNRDTYHGESHCSTDQGFFYEKHGYGEVVDV